MIEYTLRVHAYDVDVPFFGTYRHSGYDLIIKYDDNTVVIQTVDLSSADTENAIFYINENNAYMIKDKNNKTIYWDEPLSENEIIEGQPEAKDILTGPEALEAFNKIKLDAALTNLVNQIDYDLEIPWFMDGRVCNTATQYWAKEYIPGYENSDITSGMYGNFWGKDDDYINATNYQQAQKLTFINQLVESLAKLGAVDDVLIPNSPYIDDKYLQILEPLLAKDFHCNYNTLEIIEAILSEMISGVIHLSCFFIDSKEFIKQIKDLFETAEETRSPLVLDLDGDGIETITADSGVYFDHDGNLFQEKTAWVAKDDALLVRDIRLAA